MKKSVCLYFEVHQPTRLRLYRFFDIGKDSHYYDDFANRTSLKGLVSKCYLPMNEIVLDAIRKSDGQVKVAFSISGSALDLFERYAPEVIDSFKMLAQTGCVEFLCEPYNHSLASLSSPGAFKFQVQKHRERLKELFGAAPEAFKNTELIYSDDIAAQVYDLGFKTILTEGAKHIMGWRSPNYIYSSSVHDDLKLILRNYSLSDDITYRFGDSRWDNWPLTAEKYQSWLDAAEGDTVNVFMDYESFGIYQDASTGIFEFMKDLFTRVYNDPSLEFVKPSDLVKKHDAVAELEVPEPISWCDEERGVVSWLGNELQRDAFNKIYSLSESLSIIDDQAMWADFNRLQESDHFLFMGTGQFSPGNLRERSPYDTPYDAYINYMNVVSDFMIRVDNALAEKN